MSLFGGRSCVAIEQSGAQSPCPLVTTTGEVTVSASINSTGIERTSLRWDVLGNQRVAELGKPLRCKAIEVVAEHLSKVPPVS